MSRAEQFEELRPLLFSIAYRLLGSVGEAEDTVQETWLRWDASGVEPTSVRSYLSTVVTRVAIDVLRSARVRREAYPGAWFPEPLLDDPYEDPARAAELADSLSTAALLLLERLSPLERAVFVLREVFAFDFADVAAAVDRSEAACRQLASRARRHMAEGRPRFDVDRRARDELAHRFFEALRVGDVDALQEVLAADVRMVADAGEAGPRWGKATFAGRAAVCRFVAAMAPSLGLLGVVVEEREVNGEPGAIVRDRDGNVVAAMVLDVADDRVQTVRTVTNPDKLAHLGPLGDGHALRRQVARVRYQG